MGQLKKKLLPVKITDTFLLMFLIIFFFFNWPIALVFMVISLLVFTASVITIYLHYVNTTLILRLILLIIWFIVFIYGTVNLLSFFISLCFFLGFFLTTFWIFRINSAKIDADDKPVKSPEWKRRLSLDLQAKVDDVERQLQQNDAEVILEKRKAQIEETRNVLESGKVDQIEKLPKNYYYVRPTSQTSENYHYVRPVIKETWLEQARKKIKWKILTLSKSNERIELETVADTLDIAVPMVVNIVKEMLKNNDIKGEFFKSTNTLVIRHEDNAEEIDKLIKTFEKWEDKNNKKEKKS